jgi:hypothetical protein
MAGRSEGQFALLKRLSAFGRRLKTAVAPDVPRIAIDATLTCASGDLFEHRQTGFVRLRHALKLAVSLRDLDRVAAVRDAIVAHEDRVAEDRYPGTWGVAFDELVEDKPRHLDLPDVLRDKIIADLEARLARLAQPADSGGVPDGFAVEAAALRLGRHYRRIGRSDDARRVLLEYGRAFGAAGDRAAPSLAMAWLERVLDAYRSFGLVDEADAIAVRLRELGPRAVKEMKPTSTSTEVPTEEVERFLEAMTAGTLEEVLPRIVQQFLTTKAKLTEQVAERAKLAPLWSIATQTPVDRDGRPTAEIGSVEDDLDGRPVQEVSQTMHLEAPWLRAVMKRPGGVMRYWSPAPRTGSSPVAASAGEGSEERGAVERAPSGGQVVAGTRRVAAHPVDRVRADSDVVEDRGATAALCVAQTV